jgi:uncharacterized protein (TIGR00299 family) protein
MGNLLYFDCFSGASGDMILGALLDAGLPLDELRRALGSLGAGTFSLAAERVSRAGVAATKFRVIEEPAPGPQPPAPGRNTDQHDHHHHHHHHSLAQIAALIDRSALSAAGKDKAKALFRRLGEVEADIHQIPVDRVHLHEVGALDSIVDIVGAVFAFEWFGADEVMSSPLNLGSGTVKCEHGTFPVPAPATARLVTGVPVYSSGLAAELVTPTGALLVTGYAASFGSLPPMRIDRIGYGAGDRDFKEMPNVLRVLVGERSGDRAGDRVVVLEFEVDDMNPQLFGTLMDRLYAAGALEVFYAAVQMKKNRPGTLVTVVAPPARRDELSGLVFRETTTIGLRYQEVQRECLAREVVEVETPVGCVRFKIARREGRVLNASPEFDDCVKLAAERGLPVKEVQAIAMKAYLDRQTK